VASGASASPAAWCATTTSSRDERADGRCVEIWEANAEKLHYTHRLHRARPSAQEPDLVAVYERQERIGYPSELSSARTPSSAHARRVPRLACPRPHRLPARARRRLRVQPRVDAGPGRHGPRGRRHDHGGVEVPGFELDGSDAVTPCTPARRHRRRAGRRRRRPVGRLAVGHAEPARPPRRPPAGGSVARDVPMWTYWYLQEGEIAVDPVSFTTADARCRRCCTSTPTSRCATTTTV